MIVLAMNCGSSSLKYQLIDSANENVLAKGYCERIGIDGHFVYQPTGKREEVRDYDIPTHREAIMLALYSMKSKKSGAIKDLTNIDAVGHRIAHGGEKFKESTLITRDFLNAIREYSELAPLHNPINLLGISVCREFMPKTPMIAVFDTAFHQTMPKKAYTYPIPYEFYERFGIRKYGFHGTSHKYVSEELAKFTDRDLLNSKEIICHLGSSVSISAVLNGKCVDTSMGFTPLSGLAMGTRSGDLDPSIVSFLSGKLHRSIDEILEILNRKSGVYGISKGLSADFRDLESAAAGGNEYALLALEVFAYQVALTIGAYVTAMCGVDAIAFTGGIGEKDSNVRSRICQYLEYLGFVIDQRRNAMNGQKVKISTDNSKVDVCIIPTNEELEICRNTIRIMQNMEQRYVRGI